MLGIYIHIPYCRTLCPYCDFVKKRVSGKAPDVFVDALLEEIAAYEGPREAGSIFFGGGTPSLLADDSLAQILGAMAERFALDVKTEITLEANPDDVTAELVAAWKRAGINRVSLGIQSFDDRVLRYLGRRHNAAAARAACKAVAAEFENWNLDLIFGAPPVEAWEETLRQCVALNPPHVAAYGLTYEAGTPFERRKSEAVEDEVSLRMYQEAEAALSDYDHYEISNFAKPGYASRHNLVYWHNNEYAGFGPGAYSYIDGVRARNNPDIDAWMRAPAAKMEALRLSPEEVRVETLIQHFRLRRGLRKADYAARFGAGVEAHYGPLLADLKRQDLLAEDRERVWPTSKGFYLNNEIGLALVG